MFPLLFAAPAYPLAPFDLVSCRDLFDCSYPSAFFLFSTLCQALLIPLFRFMEHQHSPRNHSQSRRGLRFVVLIQGTPGTGKTTTAAPLMIVHAMFVKRLLVVFSLVHARESRCVHLFHHWWALMSPKGC